jgi:hypothetical protein
MRIRQPRLSRVAAVALGLLAALPAAAQAATVTNTADSGPGSLRDAINNSASGETIDFSLGPGSHTITLAGSALVVPHALTISGPGASSLTVDGNQQSGVFDIEANAANVTISGLTITHGALSGTGKTGGGGILDHNAALLTLSGVAITGNQATVSSAQSTGGGGVFVDGGDVTVTNSTISGNQVSITGATSGDNGGGGLYDAGGDITLTGTAVNGNTVNQTGTSSSGSDGGGGIYSDGGDLAITGGSVDNNSADADAAQGGSDGGGAIHNAGGDITLAGTTVNANSFTVGTANSGDDGAGGILSEGGDLTVTSSSIDGNHFNVTDASTSGSSGDDGGGGLLSEGGNISVIGSSISQNTGTVTAAGGPNGDGGGAIYDEGAHAIYQNSTLSNNSVTVNGGGPPSGGGAINSLGGGTATDVTIAGNSINQPGGAILNRFGTFRFRNTIIAGTCAGAGSFASDGFNLDSGNTCGLNGTGDLINTDPQLGPLQNNGGPTRTRALAATSPAVDAGACTDAGGNAVSVDQRGVARPQPAGGKCDIGAYELVPSSAPPPPAPAPPAAHTGAPSSKTSTGARLTGIVNPERQTTTYFFQYGLNPSLRPPGASTALYDQRTGSQSLPADTSDHTVSASISGLVPNALYHARVVAVNATGTTFGPDLTFTTLRGPAPPPPRLGRTENATPAGGHVFLLIGGRLIPLTETTKLPSGTTIDARRGSVALIAASTKRRERQTGVFGGAIFKLTQTHAGLTTLALREGAFQGAPSYASCRVHKAPEGHVALSSRALQTLRSRASGHFRTQGRYAAGTVRGTRWTTADRCDGTLISVQQHSVLVTDLVKKITVLVKAGHHYLARPHR